MTRRDSITLLAAVSCALAMGACGSSSSSNGSSGSTPSSGAPQGIKFADCMRAHGVPKFPDPGSGGGIQITPGSGLDPQSPAFQSAQSACSTLLPGGGPGRNRKPSAQDMRAMLATSECMRAHGVTGFPDPRTAPPPSISGYSQVMGRDGAFIAVPDTIDTASPVYTQAAAACRFGAPGRAKEAPAP